MDGYSKGNSVTGGILHDHWSVVLAAFGSLLGHQYILFAKLIIVCENLNFAIQLGYFEIKAKFDSTTVISSINLYCSTRWNFIYLFGCVRALFFGPSILIRHVLWEVTSTANFTTNWTCVSLLVFRFSRPSN